MAAPPIRLRIPLGRALLTWLVLAVAMIAAGALRVLAVAPRAPAWATELFGAALGVALILAITRPFVRGLSDQGRPAMLQLAALWVVVTVAFEFLFGHYGAGRSWRELVGNYDLTSGHLWPLVLAAVAAAPLLWRRQR